VNLVIYTAQAAPFASSTAGYITGVVTPVATALLVVLISSMRSRFNKLEASLMEQNKTLASQSQGLAIVVSQMQPMEIRVTTLEQSNQEMGKATAVLQDALARHERWHERHEKEH